MTQLGGVNLNLFFDTGLDLKYRFVMIGWLSALMGFMELCFRVSFLKVI